MHPSLCIPSRSRCLHSCQHNPHCACHQLANNVRCRQATRRWIENEFQAGPVEPIRSLMNVHNAQSPWTEPLKSHLIKPAVEQLENSGEHLFFSVDQRTGIVLREHDDDYLLNERWTKLESNTSQQHLIYTQVDVRTHSVRSFPSLFPLFRGLSSADCRLSRTMVPFFMHLFTHVPAPEPERHIFSPLLVMMFSYFGTASKNWMYVDTKAGV